MEYFAVTQVYDSLARIKRHRGGFPSEFCVPLSLATLRIPYPSGTFSIPKGRGSRSKFFRRALLGKDFRIEAPPRVRQLLCLAHFDWSGNIACSPPRGSCITRCDVEKLPDWDALINNPRAVCAREPRIVRTSAFAFASKCRDVPRARTNVSCMRAV